MGEDAIILPSARKLYNGKIRNEYVNIVNLFFGYTIHVETMST